jgi:hypothetical protein
MAKTRSLVRGAFRLALRLQYSKGNLEPQKDNVSQDIIPVSPGIDVFALS